MGRGMDFTGNRWVLGRACTSLLAAIACTLATPAVAQNDKMTPIAIPAQPGAIGRMTR